MSDFLVPFVALALVFLGANRNEMPHGLDDFLEIRLTLKNLLLIGWFAGAWRLLCVGARLYDASRTGAPGQEALRVMLVAAAGAASAGAFPLFSVSGAIGYPDLLPLWALMSVLMLLQRQGTRVLAARASHEVLIVGTGPRAVSLYQSLRQGSRGVVSVLGFVDDDHPNSSELLRNHVIGGLDELETVLMHNAVDHVLITLPLRSNYVQVQKTIDVCARAGVRAEYLADVFEAPRRGACFEQAPHFATVAMPAVSEEHWKLFVKRLMDVTGAAVALVALAPLMLAVALAVKLTTPGPVIYRQERFGHRRRRFTMYKFRTMTRDAEARQAELESLNEVRGPAFKVRNDVRVTPVGRLLRKTSIDELPQLVNVLRGDMSLVGPRPLPVRDVSRLDEAELMRRFSVKPGMTGLWQVSGRSDLPFDTWMRLDLQYIDEWSLGLDCWILLRTIPAVLRGTGAS